MRFSVIIVNYASWPYTLRCVEALLTTGYEGLEITIVDNDRKPVPDLPPGVRLIRNEDNVGFARAHNRGIRASGGDCVVFANPDTLVGRDFFENLANFFGEHPDAGIVGPRILDDSGAVQLSARKEIGFISGLLGRTSLLTRLFPDSVVVRRLFPASERLDGPTIVDWVSGACMAARRDLLEKIEAFDERFFMYFEDADLCRRAREGGRLVYYLPGVEVVHHTGKSSRSKPLSTWRLHKSAFLYHRKHGPHGPLGVYSLVVLIGLTARALAKLAVSQAFAIRHRDSAKGGKG
ncbi:MAG: glycosyltransferase family 2 protein [Rubrobacter sp.]|nr:glycosyltransferase family 2 protein [Rubrobacter sp.]